MFYPNFTRKEIHEMLTANGFSFSKDFKFPMSGSNQAYVFNANGDILVDRSLGLTEQLKGGKTKETQPLMEFSEKPMEFVNLEESYQVFG